MATLAPEPHSIPITLVEMRHIFVVLSFVALAIASSVYDARPFQSHCDNIVFNQFNIGGYCDNGTPWWTYNVQYWGTCVGLDAANKLVCADRCVRL